MTASEKIYAIGFGDLLPLHRDFQFALLGTVGASFFNKLPSSTLIDKSIPWPSRTAFYAHAQVGYSQELGRRAAGSIFGRTASARPATCRPLSP
jgi:hypothetical protein